MRRTYALRLKQLDLADRYKLGDVAAHLLRCWGVAADEPSGAVDPRLAAVLPDHAEAVSDIGIGGVLIRDGIRPVPALVEELERLIADIPVADSFDEQELWEKALTTYRSRARVSRDQELDWLTSRMRVRESGVSWSREKVRALLLELWISGARWHDLNECVSRVRGAPTG